ncbi:hypothetical protein [Demequina soli]|uniref:hypothetical protein n=1 Tax=Demequina soli TaxID=1638987 RepID=UPI00078403A7|nr:hypothetical protein [Demequina soli]
MSSITVPHYGAEGATAPAPTDVARTARDSLREVADRFAAAGARRKERRALRAQRMPSAAQITQVIGDSFALPTFGRIA